MMQELLVCDLTQSWSAKSGGGITTYLKEKRDYFLDMTPHQLLQIVPGAEDKVTTNGRHTFVEVGAGQVWGSPNYRFISRTGAVHEVLGKYRPDVIESLCPWVLPWTAIRHRFRHPETALVAGYRTDFPNAHIYRVAKHLLGDFAGRGLRRLSLGYARQTYRHFDRIYTLNQQAHKMFRRMKLHNTGVLPLGVNLDQFSPTLRDPDYRSSLGLSGHGPLLIYAGRIDNEKRVNVLIEMFRKIPPELGADMVMLGDGKLRAELMASAEGLPVAFPGFESDRNALARALASSDIYVSAMADETFGISILEAQAAGLPIVGVASGAMPERVPSGTGLLGPVDDAQVMADNVQKIWSSGCRSMKAASIDHANAQNRWDQTFDQLINTEYRIALNTRDARLNSKDRQLTPTC